MYPTMSSRARGLRRASFLFGYAMCGGIYSLYGTHSMYRTRCRGVQHVVHKHSMAKRACAAWLGKQVVIIGHTRPGLMTPFP
jgi:hypothetical protein